jgi:hypothetical protein
MPHAGTAYADTGMEEDQGGGAVVPFTRASYHYREKMFTDTVLLSTSQQPQTPHNIIPGGFLRGVWLEVSGTGGVLNSAVLGATSDFPYSLISSITLEDVNGQAIVGPITGYELYLVNKYGGYYFQSDPTLSPAFTGTFASPYFVIWLPCEIRSDALGSLANTDARAQYRLVYTIDAQSNITSTGTITTQPTLTITGWVDYWAQVEARSMQGDAQEVLPPALGTTQFWYHEVPVVASGAQTIKHNRVGNAIRTIVYVLRNGAAATGSLQANQRVNNFTDPIKLRLDNRYLFSESPNLRRAIMSKNYDLNGTDGDPATIGQPVKGFRDTGVLVYSYAKGLDYHPSPADEGNWLDTNEAQFLQLEDSLNATVASLTILTNDVAPRNPRD